MMKERGSRNETESNSTLQIATVPSPGIPVEILGDPHEPPHEAPHEARWFPTAFQTRFCSRVIGSQNRQPRDTAARQTPCASRTHTWTCLMGRHRILNC